MKRPYEVTLLFRILSTEDELQAAVDQVINYIEMKSGDEPLGKVTKIDRNLLGRRKLAYEIDGQREGIYYVISADIDPSHITELELSLKLFNPLLRFLVVRDESDRKPAKPVPPPIPPQASEDEEEGTEGDSDE